MDRVMPGGPESGGYVRREHVVNEELHAAASGSVRSCIASAA